MFSESLSKHEEYCQRCLAERGKYSTYDAEIGKKIAQINWLVSKAQILNSPVSGSIKEGKSLDLESIWELEIITESFYYFVGRIVELFKRNPNFVNVPPSDAEKIRHQLLQHPETQKERQKSSPSFECGSVDGPRIKSYSGPAGSLNDNGLFENAREFNRKLVYVFDVKAKKN
jgi:hypothetical protein